MKKPFYLSEATRQTIVSEIKRELEGKSNLAFAYLYGSVIEREMIHDIDIGIYLFSSTPHESGEELSALTDQLSALLKIPVDIRILNNAPLSFLYHVLRGELLLCRDEELLASLLEDVPRQYLDLAPLLRQSTRDAFAV